MFYPAARQRPVANHSGSMSLHLGLVLHVQQGDNSPYGEFSNHASEASSTFWVGKDGCVEQYVDANVVAWAQEVGNGVYNSVETEGFATESLTEAQVQALAQLYAWGAKTYGWPLQLADEPGKKGFGWHGMGGRSWGGHTGCPGDIRKAQRVEILARAGALLNPVPSMTIKTTDLGDIKVAGNRIDYNNVQLDENGNGWEWCQATHDNIVSFRQQGSYPPNDRYWKLCSFGSQSRVDSDGHNSVIEITGGAPKQVINFSVWTT